MKRSFILFFCFLISLWSCSETQNEKISDVHKTSKVNDTDTVSDGTKVFEEFFPNGQLRIKGQLVNGKKEGVWNSYHANGNKQSENEYFQDMSHGKSVNYYDNGQIMYIGYYKNGKYDGDWVYFSKEGKPVQKIVYQMGDPIQTFGADELQEYQLP